ncbi:MAG TPA: OmpA family protein, partial [Candidatus Peribacteraceae bacterium]|nr:OmpA family protein [Candidatus Peribacteraceae bacterium]
SGMLPALTGDSWLIAANGADDVYRQLRRANKDELRAYVLWEPSLSRALEDPEVHVLYSSTNVSGMLVDVLLVNREYLQLQPLKCKQIVEAYFTALYAYMSKPDGMINLLMQDGQQMGDIISREQAVSMASKIQWKNTMENYAHFGLLSGAETQGLPRIDTMISSIARLLVKTGKLKAHPMAGHEHEMYSSLVLQGLREMLFHPGGSGQADHVRGNVDLAPLTQTQWAELTLVGNMDAQTIDFVRARAELTVQSKRDVEEIVGHLRDWPNYYLKVLGHARPEGDPTANLALALARAKAVADRIVALGINGNRVLAEASAPGTENAGQSVTFMLLRQPY